MILKDEMKIANLKLNIKLISLPRRVVPLLVDGRVRSRGTNSRP